jgi:hypothetical protein
MPSPVDPKRRARIVEPCTGDLRVLADMPNEGVCVCMYVNLLPPIVEAKKTYSLLETNTLTGLRLGMETTYESDVRSFIKIRSKEWQS